MGMKEVAEVDGPARPCSSSSACPTSPERRRSRTASRPAAASSGLCKTTRYSLIIFLSAPNTYNLLKKICVREITALANSEARCDPATRTLDGMHNPIPPISLHPHRQPPILLHPISFRSAGGNRKKETEKRREGDGRGRIPSPEKKHTDIWQNLVHAPH